MCAINGFSFSDKTLVESMNRVTAHRGPDGTGVYTDEHVSLGNNRLAILDPRDIARQPMESVDGRSVLVLNGEIYNFRELKKELSDYPFKTKSDTEVLLAAYSKWGRECVEHLNGMFAFALWDKKKKELFLARDPIGIKPLYYSVQKGKLFFSSEIKGILEHKSIPRQLNREALEHYLRIQYTPEPLTMFEGIYKLPPAHSALFREGTLTLTKYWETKAGKPRSASPEALRDVVQSAVKRQLVSDKPLGVYLSGGIDSSAVLASMAAGGHERIDTFSIGFELGEHEESEKFNADFELARATAKHFNTRHHEVKAHSRDVIKHIEKVVWHMDEPIANPTSVVQYTLAHFAKGTGVDVVLGGDGGDELFGGYERYRLSRAASLYQSIMPKALRGLANFHARLAKLNTPPGAKRLALFMFQEDEVWQEIAPHFTENTTERYFEEHYFAHLHERSPEEALMEIDRQSWLVDESLIRSDKMSMAAGLEQRVPLLDLEVVHFAKQIPLAQKVSPFQTKILLKEAFRGHIPEALFNQPKRGWFAPGAKWLRHRDMERFAKEVLSREFYTETATLFNWDGVQRMLEDHISKRRYNLTPLWSLLTFQLWARAYDVKLG